MKSRLLYGQGGISLGVRSTIAVKHVDDVRQLLKITRLKGVQSIVVDVEGITLQAQNAFLKLLEEPAEGLELTLITHNINELTPTVLSRLEKTEVRRLTREQSEELLVGHPRKEQILFLAEGLSEEVELLKDEEYFTRKAGIMRDARMYLMGGTYDRLLLADKYKDRETTLILLEYCMKLLERGILESKPLIGYMNSFLTAYDRIEANGNIRLNLSVIMLDK